MAVGEDDFIFTCIIIFLIALLAMVILYMKFGRRKGKSSIERLALDALISYGCVEAYYSSSHSTATVREIAHAVYTKEEYQQNPKDCDYRVACCLIGLEKSGMIKNDGIPTDNPETAIAKGHWYIKESNGILE